MRRTALLATVLLAFPLALPAQSHPLVGEWKLALVVGGRMENGVVTPINGTATLTVSVAGDSLIANLQTDPVDGQPARPAVRMTALKQAGDVVFVSRGPARLNINGETREVTGVSTWTLRANGEKLEGTTVRSIEGADEVQLPNQAPQPVTGVRTSP